ncbi:unnamed protein product [Protopolystoma xenopodis]|uniref:Uncharacterized protein n=1 Tax=Protopolystoma xenopodis TaxID=117903 RepID=A0A3S4ZWC8_9PLAT|nr:unnamed protein product [Protopolystoma xenopodis]
MSLLTFKSILSSFRTTLVTPLDDFYSREDPLLKHTREYEDAYSNLLELISNSGRSDIYPHLSDLFLFVGSILGKELYEGYDSRLGGIINGAKALLHALLLLFDTSSARYLLLFPSNQLDPSSIPIAQNITHICTKAIATTRIDNQPVLFSRLPMCQNALVWLGMQLSYPELSDPPFMHVFQPLCLQLTEDFREDAIKCGFQLLEHFSINCRTADWRDNSRAEAVLSQLLNRRFISDPNSSSAVLQSLFKSFEFIFQTCRTKYISSNGSMYETHCILLLAVVLIAFCARPAHTSLSLFY